MDQGVDAFRENIQYLRPMPGHRKINKYINYYTLAITFRVEIIGGN